MVIVAKTIAGMAGLYLLTLSHAFAQVIPVKELLKLADQCAPNVASMTLASVAMTESSFNALSVHNNTTGVSRVAVTAAAGASLVDQLIAAGHSVDVGLMQINSQNFRSLGLTARTAFDPCASMSAAAQLLSGRYAGGKTVSEQQAALRGSLSAYNTGNTADGFRNGYVRRVEASALRLVPAIALDRAAPEAAPRAAAPPVERRAAAPADAQSSWDVWAGADQDSSADQTPRFDDLILGEKQ